MDEVSFNESEDAWKELFGNIFNVNPDKIELQHYELSSEIAVQVRSKGLEQKDEILDLMKNGSEFKSLIKTEQGQLNELKKFDVKEVSPKPESSK